MRDAVAAVDPYLLAIKVGAAAIGDEADPERVARRVLDAATPLLEDIWRRESHAGIAGQVERLQTELDGLAASWWEVLGRIGLSGGHK